MDLFIIHKDYNLFKRIWSASGAHLERIWSAFEGWFDGGLIKIPKMLFELR